MRGTLTLLIERDGRRGIIPANAGNTFTFDLELIEERDHPR